MKRLQISFCNLYEFPESWLFGLEKLEHLELNDNNLVTINIGQPNFEWKNIPLSKEMDNKNLKIKVLFLFVGCRDQELH